MGLPIIICDDSSFARKQVARALPPGWGVEVTYAGNGREALEALDAGRGELLFLDLTMPEMDGFEVLAHLREQGRAVPTIVVSGDIQPESHERVMALGALAFLEKPVDPDALSEVLERYGLFELGGGGGHASVPRVDFHDQVQEVANVAMGQAASLLATVVGVSVELSIPRVNVLEPCELDMMLKATTAFEGVILVNQGFIGHGLSGETMVVLDQCDTPRLAALVDRVDGSFSVVGYELVMDIANTLVGAFLKGFADQLNINLSQGQPEIFVHEMARAGGGPAPQSRLSRTLAIELSYTLGQEQVYCDQLVLFTEDSRDSLRHLIDYALG